MIDFIPLEFYTPIYYYFLMVVLFFTFIITQTENITTEKNIVFIKNVGLILLLVIIPYMGLRPINGRYFGDTETYGEYFLHYQDGGEILMDKDYWFHFFTKMCSNVMNVHMYFLVCAALYVLPLYEACKTWFKEYWGYAFLFLVFSFSFWAAGTNGVRSAIASSFILLAYSRKNIFYKIVWLALGVAFHKSMLLLVAAYVLTLVIRNPKWYFYAWCLCIPLSLAAAGFWENLFAGLIDDERASYLTSGNVNNDEFSSTGFRWDFLLYSLAAVYAAFYFIYKKNFKDDNYFRLVNIYLTVNGFWILVIRANFSNRFAFLSWFMMGIIITYPLLKKNFLPSQLKIIGYIAVTYFAFTFFMNVIK